jgi:hypothetical protein
MHLLKWQKLHLGGKILEQIATYPKAYQQQLLSKIKIKIELTTKGKRFCRF